MKHVHSMLTLEDKIIHFGFYLAQLVTYLSTLFLHENALNVIGSFIYIWKKMYSYDDFIFIWIVSQALNFSSNTYI